MATTKKTLGDWGWIILIVGVLCVVAYNHSYNKKMDEVEQYFDTFKEVQLGLDLLEAVGKQRLLSPQATPQQEANRRSMNEFYGNYRCPGCNGTKTYRFVTPAGRLIVQQCPYCRAR
jgi:hypothetical protein